MSEVNGLLPDNLITFMGSQMSTYVELDTLFKTTLKDSTSVLSVDSITKIDTLLSQNSDLYLECMGFLDTLRLYMTLYSGSNDLIDKFFSNMTEDRVLKDIKLLIGKSEIENRLFQTKEDLNRFLENNPSVKAIYLFGLFKRILHL